jgi:hypothetical protein
MPEEHEMPSLHGFHPDRRGHLTDEHPSQGNPWLLKEPLIRARRTIQLCKKECWVNKQFTQQNSLGK